MGRVAALFGKLVATGVPVHFASRARLEELSKTSEHQCLLARLGAYVYGTMEELRLSLSQASGYPIPLIVMCDRIQDTFNFGAILRCCDGAQVTAVIVWSAESAAAMTPHVIRSSSGAANYVPVIQASDLDEAVRSLKALGCDHRGCRFQCSRYHVEQQSARVQSTDTWQRIGRCSAKLLPCAT